MTRDHCDGIILYVSYGSNHMTLHMIKWYENIHTVPAYKTGENWIMLVDYIHVNFLAVIVSCNHAKC